VVGALAKDQGVLLASGKPWSGPLKADVCTVVM